MLCVSSSGFSRVSRFPSVFGHHFSPADRNLIPVCCLSLKLSRRRYISSYLSIFITHFLISLMVFPFGRLPRPGISCIFLKECRSMSKIILPHNFAFLTLHLTTCFILPRSSGFMSCLLIYSLLWLVWFLLFLDDVARACACATWLGLHRLRIMERPRSRSLSLLNSPLEILAARTTPPKVMGGAFIILIKPHHFKLRSAANVSRDWVVNYDFSLATHTNDADACADRLCVHTHMHSLP